MAKSTEEKLKTDLKSTMIRLNSSYGLRTVLSLDDNTIGNYDTISSGSLGLDYITLGIGGFAKGKLYELMGWEGVGKSTICGHVMANCQRQGGLGLYIDGEHALDKNYFEALGVDSTKMLISQPSSGEEGFQIAKEMIATGELDLLIIDSDSSLLPKSVIDGEVGDSAIGKKARLNNNIYPVLKSLLVKNKTCVIVVSQYREKIGVMFGSNTTTQGGHALKFYTDCRIEMSKSQAKDGEVVYGNITKMKATKNKLASPYRSCTFDIVYGEGIDAVGEILELGVEYDIVTKSGSWYNYGDIKLGQGKLGVTKILKDNPELVEELRIKIIDKINPIHEEVLQ